MRIKREPLTPDMTRDRVLQALCSRKFNRIAVNDFERQKIGILFDKENIYRTRVVNNPECYTPMGLLVIGVLECELLWGYPRRNFANKNDIETLARLREIDSRVADIYQPGLQITVIFTDSHAHLNGRNKDDMASYRMDITSKMSDMRLCSGKLRGEIASSWQLDYFDRYEKYVYGDIDRCLSGSLDRLKEEFERSKVKDRLIRAAAKHCTTKEPEEGAFIYYAMRKFEAEKIFDRKFEDAPEPIFLTYTSPDFRELLPKRPPVLFLYSHGTNSKPPWID